MTGRESTEPSRVVMAHDLAGNGLSLLERLKSRCAFDSRDWSGTEHDAVLYAVVLGWSSAWSELQQRYGWTDEEVRRLKRAGKALRSVR